MPFYHNHHYFQVQSKKTEQLNNEIGAPPLRSFGWNRRVKLVFICAVNSVFHDIYFIEFS
jgi:hypothetical protein